MAEAGAPVRFQIGEPWWWITPRWRASCLYDDAARAAFGGDPAGDRRHARGRSARRSATCSTLRARCWPTRPSASPMRYAPLRQAAREVLLLVFTPTVLDPAMPEAPAREPAGRLGLPGVRPVAGRGLRLADRRRRCAAPRGLRRRSTTRLGYPPAAQDYLAGFVLDPDDADDAVAADRRRRSTRRRARGVARRFVWASPQVARDGYTRFATPQEDTMQAFDDVLYPLALGRDAGVSPEFSTSVAVTASGHERRNALWSDARLRFDVGPGHPLRGRARHADRVLPRPARARRAASACPIRSTTARTG